VVGTVTSCKELHTRSGLKVKKKEQIDTTSHIVTLHWQLPEKLLEARTDLAELEQNNKYKYD